MSELLRPFARVWGRSLAELTLEVPDPVGRGFFHRPIACRGLVGTDAGTMGAPASALPGLARLRPVWGRDHWRVDDVRRANHDWLAPWEATLPPGMDDELPDIGAYARRIDRDQSKKRALVMLVEIDGKIAGQFSLSNVVHGAMSQGMLGYWMCERWAGWGVGSLCTALMIDLVIGELGLHRIEIDVRPENAPSMGLCRKLGLHSEGIRPRFMHIAGAWADHHCFSIDAESLPEGGLVRAVWGGDATLLG